MQTEETASVARSDATRTDASPVDRASARLRLTAHWPFGVLLALGLLVRAAMAGVVRPASFFLGDSISYLDSAVDLSPGSWRPSGYSFFLKIFYPLHSLTVVVAVQMLLGLLLAVLAYGLLLRVGVRRWLTTLAVAPLLLDGYAVQLETEILSDQLFLVLVTGALIALCWTLRRPPWLVWLVVGVALGASVVVRNVGLAAVAVGAVSLVLHPRSWRVLPAFLAALAAPVAAYAIWVHGYFGTYGLERSPGVFLYGRVQPWSSCAGLSLTTQESVLCDPRPQAEKHPGNWYIWNSASPLNDLPGGASTRNTSDVAASFARKVILHEPLGYLNAVGGSLAQTFSWRDDGPSTSSFLIPSQAPSSSDPRTVAANKFLTTAVGDYQAGHAGSTTISAPGAARALRTYQQWVRVPGQILAIALAIALLAGMVGRRYRHLWLVSVTFGLAGFALLLTPAVTQFYDARYVLAALPACCIGFAAGAETIVRRLGERAERPGPVAEPPALVPAG